MNETNTCPYDNLSGNTRGPGHLREDVVRAHLVQGFLLLTSILFNFGEFDYSGMPKIDTPKIDKFYENFRNFQN